LNLLACENIQKKYQVVGCNVKGERRKTKDERRKAKGKRQKAKGKRQKAKKIRFQIPAPLVLSLSPLF